MTTRRKAPPQVIRGGSWVIRDCPFVSAANKGTDKPDLFDSYVSFRSYLPLRAPR